jgi:hypothetical protein
VADRPLDLQCAEKLFHLLYTAFDTSGGPDFSRAPQGARLLHELLPVP